MANYVYTEQYTNIRLKDTEPKQYFADLKAAIEAKTLKIATVDDWNDLLVNLEENEIPLSILEGTVTDYNDFLTARRQLMATAIKNYYYSL